MSRKLVAVIIPDASSTLTLAGIDRVELLGSFSAPVKTVDPGTPMIPFENAGLAKTARSTWLRRSFRP